MITLHPNILTKAGKKEFAVLPYEEFIQLQEELELFDDLRELRNAKDIEKDSPTMSLDDVKQELGLK